MLMHMGSMAIMGAYAPKNIVHIIVNNSSHESVGGQPTVAEIWTSLRSQKAADILM